TPKTDVHFERAGDERLVGKSGKTNLLALGQGVPFWNGCVIGMPVDNKARQLRRIALRRSDERDIEDAIDQSLQLRRGVHADDLKRHIGVIPLKVADHFGQHADAARRQDIANLYRADVTACGTLADKLGVLGLFEGGARLFEKSLASLCQQDGAFLTTRKELRAEHPLQGLNLVAERR